MREAIFYRVLGDVDKGRALNDLVKATRSGVLDTRIFSVDLAVFTQVPGAPFCYWAADSVIRAFAKFPRLGVSTASVQTGVSTKDDFRFLRLWSEVDIAHLTSSREGSERQHGDSAHRWARLAKGGEYTLHYLSPHLVVDWTNDAEAIKASVVARYPYLKGNPDWIVHPESSYFTPGITYPMRTTSSFSPRVLPAGCVFSSQGLSIFPNVGGDREWVLGLLTTRVLAYMLEMLVISADAAASGSAARRYETGLIASLPVAPFTDRHREEVGQHAREIALAVRSLEEADELSSFFGQRSSIVWLSTGRSTIKKSVEAAVAWEEGVFLDVLRRSWEGEQLVRDAYQLDAEAIRAIEVDMGPHPASLPRREWPEAMLEEFRTSFLKSIEEIIDEEVSRVGGARFLTKKAFVVDRRLELLAFRFGCHPADVSTGRRELGLLGSERLKDTAVAIVSQAVGLAFGRWDIRLLRDSGLWPKAPGLWDVVPKAPPVALVDPDGLPARAGTIASAEWLRTRSDASLLPRTGSVPVRSIEDGEYPLSIPWNGILVDDPSHGGGIPGVWDIIRRVRDAFEVLFAERTADVEAELCELLDVRELREYLRLSLGFFADHLSRYSRSRRKAPIYWPLATESGRYTVWIYYPRLAEDTLFRVVTEHVEPKLSQVEQRFAQVSAQQGDGSRRDTARLAQEAGELTELRDELREMRVELLRVAQLPYKPCLDDGVQITAAPLWRLFRHRPWRKTLEETWKDLERGDHDWTHLAMAIWPERVRDKCRLDRSLAMAHGIDGVTDGDVALPRQRRSRKKPGRKEEVG